MATWYFRCDHNLGLLLRSAASSAPAGARGTDGRDVRNQEGAWIQVLPTQLYIRTLRVFSPQHVDYCHPRVSGAPGRLHQLLLHLCDSCCAGCLKDICSCLVASSDHDYRASVRELHIPPWTHIFQDGFQVASEAGSTQHVIKPRLLYFYDISGSLLLYSSAALQEQFWHCLLVGFSSTIIRGR